MRLGDHIALLHKGKIVQFGTAEEMYHKPRNLFVARFFAEMNVFDALVNDGKVATPLGIFKADQHVNGSRVKAAIRTTGIDVNAVQQGGAGILGRITARRFLGDFEQLSLAVDGAEAAVSARIRADELPPNAKDVVIKVRESDIMLFETE